jgi:hypothetical protein
MPPDSTNRLRLSVFQLMKLVVVFAVAFSAVAPMVHLWQAGAVQGGSLSGLASVAIFGAVLVPLIWVGLSLILIRRGPWRDTLIVGLLLCSVLVALATACWMLVYQLVPAYRRSFARWDVTIAMLINTVVVLVLCAAGLFLVGWLTRAFARRGVG